MTDATVQAALLAWFANTTKGWNAAMRAALTAGLATATTDDLIGTIDERILVGLVMKLTGGSANPAVVRGQIANARERLKGTAE